MLSAAGQRDGPAARNKSAVRTARSAAPPLLDLGFFVGDVLAHHRIELAYFHLVRMQPLVFHRDIEMTGSGRRQQFDFLTHGLTLRSARRGRAGRRARLRGPSSRWGACRWWARA